MAEPAEWAERVEPVVMTFLDEESNGKHIIDIIKLKELTNGSYFFLEGAEECLVLMGLK